MMVSEGGVPFRPASRATSPFTWGGLGGGGSRLIQSRVSGMPRRPAPASPREWGSTLRQEGNFAKGKVIPAPWAGMARLESKIRGAPPRRGIGHSGLAALPYTAELVINRGKGCPSVTRLRRAPPPHSHGEAWGDAPLPFPEEKRESLGPFRTGQGTWTTEPSQQKRKAGLWALGSMGPKVR